MIDATEFLGDWRLSRRIEDAQAGQVATLEGVAGIGPEGGQWLYSETGLLHLPGQAAVSATRRYLWRAEAGGIAVAFEDGRPFHRIDLGGATCEARHDCAPDLYRVCYDFAGWPVWQTRWAVTGPRKDYVLISIYRR